MAVGGASSGGGKGIKAGRAYVEVGTDDAGLRAGLAKAKRMVMDFGKSIATGGFIALGISTAILAPITESFRRVIGHFDELNKASDRTGATTEALSDLSYAAEQSDATLEDVSNGAKFLQKNLAAAAGGSKEAQESLAKLGLTAADLKGKGLDEQFLLIADGLQAMEDPAERTAAMLAVLGRGGLALAPMLKGGSAELRKLFEQNARVGGRVSKEDAANATKVGDASDMMGKAVRNAFFAIGAALLPQADNIERLAFAFVDAIKMIKDFIDKNREIILVVVGVASALAASGFALIGIGTALFVAAVAASGFASAAAALGTVLAVVFSPIGLGVAAIAVALTMLVALAAQTKTFWEGLEAGADIASTVWGGFLDVFQRTWSGIKDALAAGDIKLAFKIGVAGLDVIWKGFLLGLQVGWNTFKGIFVDGWHDIIKQLSHAWVDFEAFLTQRLYGLVGQIADAVGDSDRSGAAATMKQEAERARQLGHKEIDDMARRAEADRKAARAAGIFAAAAELAAAKLELEALQREAAAKKFGQIGMALAFAGLGVMTAQDRRRQQAAINAMAGSRSQFGGSLAAQALGISGETIEKKQLDELKGINKGVADLQDEVGLKGW